MSSDPAEPAKIPRRGLCLVLAAPSGTGKSAITRALLDSDPNLALSISVTTRAPRPYEQEGVHYYFRDQREFDAMVASGDMLEWAGVFGRSYGSPRAPVEAALSAGRDVLFDIDWQGYRQVRAALPGDVVGLYIMPPSLAELERRLRARASDSEAEILRRMATAASEISHVHEFDYVLVNNTLDIAVGEARAVLTASRLALGRLTGLDDFTGHLLSNPA
ncbi:MAG: guanylate kinase [Acetobacteraceae bacterium]|nr:guanylate kinase [Acetobacteraceae bacterium]